MANTIFKANTKWTGESLYCEGTSRDFKIAVDEPKALGGTDKAMNPVEMLLNALGGCITICAAAFAKGCGVDLKGCSVDIEGDLDPAGFTGKDPNVRPGFQEIRYKINLDTPSPQENIQKLLDLIELRCPVSDTLKGVKVKGIK